MTGSGHEPNADPDEGSLLMLALRGGDDAAFSALIDKYRSAVLGLLYRYVGHREAAEDLCQEAFLRVYRARKTYEPRAKFKTWLFRIVHNLAINHADYQRRRQVVSLDQHEDEEDGKMDVVDPDTAEPRKGLERRELAEKVREAVLSLSPNQRLATIHSKYHGLSYEEIAQVMDLRVEAVKSLLFRAREKIRERLGPYLREEVSDEVR